MADFFISYTHTDEGWAEWIAWALEEARYSTVIQKWDFRPGGNFVLDMQRAAAVAARTIAVLSPDYLKSGFTAPEWAAAFVEDPRGEGCKLAPVRVHDCNPTGLLGPITYIDLVGKDAAEAKAALLTGVKVGRVKPEAAPPFPGRARDAKPFPGPTGFSTQRPAIRIRRAPTDLEKRRFLREGLAIIAAFFRSQLTELQAANSGVETDFDEDAAPGFRAEVYVNGQLRTNCRIWIGGMLGDTGLSYAEGSTVNMGNAINDTLSFADGDELAFRALMNMGIGKPPPSVDPNHMSPEAAAEYLWARFLWRLQ